MAVKTAMQDTYLDLRSAAAGKSASTLSTAAFTRYLALFFLANTILVGGLIWQFSPGGFQDTVFQQSWNVLAGKGGDDSWGPMAAAREYLRVPQEKPLYASLFFDQGIKFQYPPSALFGLEALMLFGEERVRTSDEMVFAGAPAINDIVGWVFLLITALSTAGLLEAGLRASGAPYAFNAWTVVRLILVCGFTLTFYPVVKAFTLGQIQLWINSLFAAALFLLTLNRKWASGVIVGLICLIKPHYGLFALWGAFNREWRFVLACVLIGGAGLFFAILSYGWANHTDYLNVLSFMSERGESYYANQSINGLLNRWASLSAPGLYNNASFDAYRFPPYNAWVYWGTFISSGVILLSALFRRSSPVNRGLAFSIVALSLTIASPIAWEHHYGVLLPIFAFAAGHFMRKPRELILLAVSFIFVSNFIPAFNLLAETPFNFLQSYLLAGGLLFLIVMHLHLAKVQVTDRHSTSTYT